VNLRKQIESFEGCKADAYLCTEGVPTIGIGHTGPEVQLGLSWSEDQIAAAFAADVAEAEDGVRRYLPWFDGLNEPRRAALIGMAFQLGIKGLLGFPKMLACLRDGRFAEAETHALDSLWARQTPKRARIVARQLSSGLWEA
jgi:lysozyme